MDGRDLGSELAAEIAAPSLRPFLALHIDFPDPVFAFTGTGELVIEGNSYVGVAGLASIDLINESTDGSATGVKASLFQVPGEFRDDIADQAVRGCLYELFLGAFDNQFQTVRGFKRIWRGTLQSYQIEDGGDLITVTAGGESRAIDQKRPSIRRFTHEEQLRRFPGDLGFEYAAKLTEVSILWAKAKQDNV